MNANLFRRLMSAFYDLLFIIAILFVAVALAMVVNQGAIEQDHPYHWLYVSYLAAISFSYYAWFWIKSGQTPGMKTWRLKLYRNEGLDLKFAVVYALASLLSIAIVGAGFLLALVHPQRRTLHDIIAGCEMKDMR